MDIFSALEALRNASPEALQNHRHETIEALREIEARLRELDSPDSDASVRAVAVVANGSDDHEGVNEIVSTQLPSPAEQPTSAGQAKIKQSRPTILLTALHTISSWVWKSANLPTGKVIQIKRPRIYDRRLNDIRRIEGDRRIEYDSKAGPKYKILRVLAQRSLVLQGEESGYLDIESYCKIASSRGSGKANGGRGGKIASYVRAGLDVEDEDKGFAIRAIQAGIKQLVTERLLKERLEEMGRCKSASGISAFTALLIRPFRSLKYTDIPEFLDSFLETDFMNFPALEENGKTENFLPVSTTEVIRVSSAWFDKLQSSYNMFLGVREEFNQHQPNKRKHKRPNYSLYDHTGSSTESPPFSDRLSTIESSSSNTDENGSIHCRPTSPQESLDSLSEVLERPQSNISSSPYSTGPETPRFTGCGLDDQNRTRHFDPSSQQRRHLNPSYTTSLIRSRSPLYNCGSRSSIENETPTQSLNSTPLPSSEDASTQDDDASLIERPSNVEPLQTAHAQQTSYAMTGADNTFSLPGNTQTMLYLSLQGEQTMARMGNTFNIHENPQSMLPLQYLGLQEGQPTTRMGRPFDVHDSPQAMLPLQNGQAMTGMGGAFNIHDNAQSMLPLQYLGLQEGQPTTRMGRPFDVHDSPQAMLPLQNGQAMTGMGGAFNIHEPTRSMLPLHYLSLEDEQQTRISAPSHQQQSIPGQPLTPPILVG